MKNRKEIIEGLSATANDVSWKINYLLDDINDCFASVIVLNRDGSRPENTTPSRVLAKCGGWQQSEVKLARKIIENIDTFNTDTFKDPVKIISEMETYHRFCLEHLGKLREDWTKYWPPERWAEEFDDDEDDDSL